RRPGGAAPGTRPEARRSRTNHPRTRSGDARGPARRGKKAIAHDAWRHSDSHRRTRATPHGTGDRRREARGPALDRFQRYSVYEADFAPASVFSVQPAFPPRSTSHSFRLGALVSCPSYVPAAVCLIWAAFQPAAGRTAHPTIDFQIFARDTTLMTVNAGWNRARRIGERALHVLKLHGGVMNAERAEHLVETLQN